MFNPTELEELESRRMLSFSLVHGIVQAIGTGGNDTMTVSIDAGKIKVDINGTSKSYLKSTVKKINLYGKAGDDTITVDESNGAIGKPIFMSGGKGDDTLTGASGNDTIQGGPGNDDIKGKGGVDDIFGGPGNDTLLGGPGHDHLFGRIGTDLFFESDDSSEYQDYGKI